MEKCDPSEIETKWVGVWEKNPPYQAIDFAKKPKKYILFEFPYPSGERLHVGHAFSFIGTDVFARFNRMSGFNVLCPIGWDAFGLPAENYAIKTGVNPMITTQENIANAKVQAKQWALSVDWSREVSTTDPKYYKWTQWIFLQWYKHGLAYKAEMPINWCPQCKIGLANEEVVAGNCERCGAQVTQRKIKQWVVKITAYADRLIEGLKNTDFIEKVKLAQINWIGKSEGVEIDFAFASNHPNSPNLPKIRVFTTALDTIFGVTFMVLSPEYTQKIIDFVPEEKKEDVSEYIEASLKRSELERQTTEKVKTGVDTGLKAINPFSQKEMPVFVADYVLAGYGTGAVMGVPGHDARDYEFAKKYNLPIIPVIRPSEEIKNKVKVKEDGFWDYPEIKEKATQAVLFNSGEYDNQTAEEAKKKLEEELVKRGTGERKINYHLRDWIFSRQHYWGEPIPVVYCANCAKTPGISNLKSQISNLDGVDYTIVPVPEDQLPVELPPVEKYQPTDTGESPLASVPDWVETKCPKCGGVARRETDTMPNWAGSDWYFLRYLDPANDKRLVDLEKARYWLPVDVYIGGDEHNTLHLLYSRFTYQFLWDRGFLPKGHPEPYYKRISHGVILGPDGQRMSKSRGNVINPDEVVAKFGVDTMRMYLMFLGPFDATMAWSDRVVQGCHRFLKRVWRLAGGDRDRVEAVAGLKRVLNKTIKKVGEDIEKMKFNTAIAAMMEFVNAWQKDPKGLDKAGLKKFLLILAPFAPFMTEELWQRATTNKTNESNLTNWSSIHSQSWPEHDKNLIEEEEIVIVVQVNGKLRGKLELASEKTRSQEEVERKAREDEKIKNYLEKEKIRKVIFVPGKLLNFVI